MYTWQVTFQSNKLLVFFVTLFVLAGAVLFYHRLHRALPPGRWGLLLALRLLGTLVLLILVFKPALGFKTALVRGSVPVLLVDTSKSMRVNDMAGGSRLESVKTSWPRTWTFSPGIPRPGSSPSRRP